MDSPFADLYAALAQARKAISTAIKSSKGELDGGRTYTYADLAAIQDACLGALAAQGLAVIQFPLVETGRAGCRTVLTHSGGAHMESTLLLPMAREDIHAAGSAITYARRYSLAALAQVPIGDSDDDGKAAMKSASKGRPPKARTAEPEKPVTSWTTPILTAELDRMARAPDSPDRNRNGVSRELMEAELARRMASYRGPQKDALVKHLADLAADDAVTERLRSTAKALSSMTPVTTAL